MRIIDAHVHTGRHHLPIEKIMQVLRESGIEEAVIFSDPESPDAHADNAYVMESADRLGQFPFYYIGGNPYSDRRASDGFPGEEELKGFRGIKWHCWFSPSHDSGGAPLGYDRATIRRLLEDDKLADFMERIKKLKLLINFEEHWDVTREFIEIYKDLTVIIPHMGALNGGSGRVLNEFVGFENVHFDTSLSFMDENLVRKIGPERLILGSDYPYGGPGGSLRRITSLKISNEEKRLILGGNLLRLIGEEGEEGATKTTEG